jgi:predicted nucleotidyltransferase
MLDRTSLITFLRKAAVDRLSCRADAIQFYLFGSAVYLDAARDVDLLVVYALNRVSPQEAAAFRQALYRNERWRLDICLLSDLEALNNPFIADEGCVLLS